MMTPEQERDERMNLITLLVCLVVLPILIGAISQSIIATLLAFAVSQGFIIVTVVAIATMHREGSNR